MGGYVAPLGRRWSASTAQDCALDALQQSHRRRNSVGDDGPFRWVGFVAVGGVLFFVMRSAWLPALGFLAVVVLGSIAYVYLVDLGERGTLERPRRIAVHDGGLVLDPGAAAPGALAWHDIVGGGPVAGDGSPADPVGVYEVVFRTADGEQARFEIGPFTARAGLIRAIEGRTPVGVPWWPRAVGGIAVAGLVGLIGMVVWQGVSSRYVTRSTDELPASSSEFADACDSPGTRYTTAARYDGETPHPIAVFPDRVRWQLGDEQQTAWIPEDPATIELVACLDRDDPGTSTDRFCAYQEAITQGGGSEAMALYTTWYRVTIYELRTHREIGSERIFGENLTCPEFAETDNDRVFAGVTDDQLHEILDPYTEP